MKQTDLPILLNPNGCSTCQIFLFNYLDSMINVKENLKIIVLSDKNKEIQHKLDKLSNNSAVIFDKEKYVVSNDIVKNEEEIVFLINNEKFVFTYIEYEKVMHMLEIAYLR
ncbi:hypothetical protein [Anditalea andensis]|uniref:hypothetical protein n=1 Tax=Anditalea andensis TaxID=1048983 RepID=UPI0013E0D52F|nr:hypothetical protein [Anditalea andensis]